MDFFEKKVGVVLVYKDRKAQEPIDMGKNHLTYLSHELATYGNFKIFFSKSIDDGIQACLNQNLEICIVISEGSHFVALRSFVNRIADQWRDSIFCMGHILDRKQSYYELHYQCFVLNLDLYRKTGAPSYMNEDPGMLTDIERSEENFHDDYTPYWIKGKPGKSFISRPSLGSHWLHRALENKYETLVFDRELRGKKHFLNTKDSFDYLDSLSYMEPSLNSDRNSFYAMNTEDIPTRDIKKPISRLIIPASGLMPFSYLKKFDYVRKTNDQYKTAVTFFDISEVSLSIYRELVNSWNGGDYLGFLEKRWKKLLKGTESFDEKMENFLKQFGGESSWQLWFEEVKQNVEFRIRTANALAPHFNKRPWVSCAGRGATVLSLSNIFHYSNTSLQYSYKYRMNRLNQHLLKIKAHHPEMWIHYCSVNPTGRNTGVPVQKFHRAEDFEPIVTVPMPWEEFKNSVYEDAKKEIGFL